MPAVPVSSQSQSDQKFHGLERPLKRRRAATSADPRPPRDHRGLNDSSPPIPPPGPDEDAKTHNSRNPQHPREPKPPDDARAAPARRRTMFPFSLLGCSPDACAASPPPPPLSSLLPLATVFALASTAAHTRLLPALATYAPLESDDPVLPTTAPTALRAAHADHASKAPRRRAASLAFSVTVGLAVLLGVLIVTEVAQVLDGRARAAALAAVVPSLAVCLVLVIPWLEAMSVVVGTGRSFARDPRGRAPRLTWALQLLLFGGWLILFWSVGGSSRGVEPGAAEDESLMRAALDRIGIAGICLMALLSGFASVSTPWHAFAPPSRPVSDGDVARKQAALDAAAEMLLAKRHRLHILERKAADADASPPPVGLVGKVWGSLRGASADEAELRALRLEVAGLEAMHGSLAAGVAAMRARRAEKARAASLAGRALAVPRAFFSVYCVYRVLATLLTTLRRLLFTAAHDAPPDPVTRVLSLLSAHYDPTLDQHALARQISFLLSGLILLLSLSSVNQTVTLLSRAAPSLLRLARANLPLLLAQILATYVFSSALLLRSNLPREVRGAVGDALRSALDPAFVEGWFQGWFLVGCAATAGGIFVSRRIEGGDEFGLEEVGEKRS